jgi:4-hydroxybenzoate polyprenyltransferase
MIDINQWSNLVAIFIPLVVGILVKQSWSSTVKGVIAFIICIAVTVVSLLIQNKLDFSNFIATLATIMAISQVAYSMLLKEFAKLLQTDVGNTDKP